MVEAKKEWFLSPSATARLRRGKTWILGPSNISTRGQGEAHFKSMVETVDGCWRRMEAFLCLLKVPTILNLLFRISLFAKQKLSLKPSPEFDRVVAVNYCGKMTYTHKKEITNVLQTWSGQAV